MTSRFGGALGQGPAEPRVGGGCQIGDQQCGPFEVSWLAHVEGVAQVHIPVVWYEWIWPCGVVLVPLVQHHVVQFIISGHIGAANPIVRAWHQHLHNTHDVHWEFGREVASLEVLHCRRARQGRLHNVITCVRKP